MKRWERLPHHGTAHVRGRGGSAEAGLPRCGEKAGRNTADAAGALDVPAAFGSSEALKILQETTDVSNT